MSFLFTSESVSEGHPDKICDQLSDAILDAMLTADPNSYCAAECFTTTNLVLVGGEIKSNAKIDVESIVRETIRKIGYTNEEYGINADTCEVIIRLHEQSADIAQGVNEGEGLHKEIGAGDQGLMFGYACKQTDEYMPLPIILSHKLMETLAKWRKSGKLKYLRPDSKAQVTVAYDDNRQPLYVDTVVLSTQHDPDVSHEQIEHDIKTQLIPSVIPASLITNDTKYFINPTGRFVIGGPHGDAGLTGRKIVVDTYGGWIPHGGGAFSGKDYTKVDRSAAYMARYVAKNLVAANVADELEIQVAYAIGVSQPVSVHVNTFGTSKLFNTEILDLIKSTFDLSPAGINQHLHLKQAIYSQTAAYGHFGRTDLNLPWENCDKVDDIKHYIKEHHLASQAS